MKKPKKWQKKIQKGGEFDLEDLLTQFQQMKNLGGMAGFLDKMPGLGGADIQKAMEEARPEEKVKEMEALIHSMTPFERQNPDKITPSRKRRIAAGSGRQIQDVNRLLKQHKQMAKMMKMISRPDGIGKMMKAVQGLARGMSGGGPLFGNKDANQAGTPNMQDMQKSMQDLGLKPEDMPSMEEMQKKMQEMQSQLPPNFKKRF